MLSYTFYSYHREKSKKFRLAFAILNITRTAARQAVLPPSGRPPFRPSQPSFPPGSGVYSVVGRPPFRPNGHSSLLSACIPRAEICTMTTNFHGRMTFFFNFIITFASIITKNRLHSEANNQ